MMAVSFDALAGGREVVCGIIEEATLVLGWDGRGEKSRWRGSVSPKCRWSKRGDNGREPGSQHAQVCGGGNKGTVYLGFCQI